MNHEEIHFLIDGLKSRLVDTVITRSTNRELNHHLY
ncbi:Fe-only/vanadium nitrogenase subunit delta [Azotobacter chroococcum]